MWNWNQQRAVFCHSDTVGWATASTVHPASWVFLCWWWRFDCSFARLIAPVVTTISITLSSNKIQNGDILVPANPGPPGKCTLKWREWVLWRWNCVTFSAHWLRFSDVASRCKCGRLESSVNLDTNDQTKPGL